MINKPRHWGLLGAAALVGSLVLPTAAQAATAVPRAAGGKVCTVVGTSGADRLAGRAGDDVICGLGGNDTITGGAGNDTLDGGAGTDTLDGGAGTDTLAGGDGNDTMSGGTGADVFTGGRGTDTVTYSDHTGAVRAAPDGRATSGSSGERDRIGTDVDTLVGGPGGDTLTGNSGPNRLDGGSGDDHLDGGAGNDTIIGGPGHDRQRGGDGDDRLSGGDGDDHLDGGRGADAVDGGFGRDTCTIVAEDVTPVHACSDRGRALLHLGAATWLGPTTVGNDQEHTTTLQVRATDDRSGVATVGASLRGPEGTPGYGTGGVRVGAGTANNGVWRLSFTLPAGTMPGPWHLESLFVRDRVGHLTVYQLAGDGRYTSGLPGSADETAAFGPITVTGPAPSSAAPVVDLPSLEWTNGATVDNSADRTVTLRVRVMDAGTDIEHVYAEVGLLDRTAVRGTSSARVAGTRRDGIWEMAATLPAGATLGEWHLLSLTARNAGNRLVTYRAVDDGRLRADDGAATVANPFPPFTVTGTRSDVAAPVIGWTGIALTTPATVRNDVDRPVGLRIPVTDDATGVQCDAYPMMFRGPDRVVFAVHDGTLVSGTPTDGVCEFAGTLPAHAPAGVWRLMRVDAVDRMGRTSVNELDFTGERWVTGGPGDPAVPMPTLTVVETELGPGGS